MLSRYENDGIELVIDQATGEAFATLNGYSQMSEKAKSTISERLKACSENEIKTAEMDTGYGVKLVRLIPAKTVFKWLIRDNPELAEKMGEFGATAYLYQIAGYQLKTIKQEETIVIKQLPTSLDRANTVNQLAASMQFFGMEIQNPRFKQSVQDLIGDMLGLTQNYLPDTSEESQEIWLGVAERAEQLGYAVALVTKHRSQLGKFVKTQDLTMKQEKRLCGGTQRPINLYLQCLELDEAIKSFLDAKILASTSVKSLEDIEE